MTAKSSELELAKLREVMVSPCATDEMRLLALSLAYDIGKTEGRSEGVIAGLNQMHEIAQKTLTDAMRRVHTPGVPS